MKKILIFISYAIIVMVGNIGWKISEQNPDFGCKWIFGFVLSSIIWLPAYTAIYKWVKSKFE